MGGTAAESWPSLTDVGATELFEKILTTSDANGQGRIVLPKAVAQLHLPRLDHKDTRVDIPCDDTFGNQYVFRFRFWVNNQSRMYLLEGTQDMQSLYGLQPGDAVAFGRSEDTGALVACGRVRPAARAAYEQQKALPRERIIVNMDRSKRRRRPPQALQDEGHAWQAADPLLVFSEPILDGVFRASPYTADRSVAYQNDMWITTVMLAGAVYQAYFESEDAAQEALDACGCDA